MLQVLLLGAALFALPTMGKIQPFAAGEAGALCGPNKPCHGGLVCHGGWIVTNGKKGFGTCEVPCKSDEDCAAKLRCDPFAAKDKRGVCKSIVAK